MQAPIGALIELGPLPASIDATVPILQQFEEQLSKVKTPITDQEARMLIGLFGPDDCFGLAWTLLHLVETAPGWPIEGVLDDVEGEWADRLRERAAARS
jgi:hypothetical protein